MQRCFTVFHPVSRVGEKLPVVLSPNCYAKDSLRGISMTSATRGDNAAATKYGYVRIGLSTPDGGWTFGNDNIVNDEKPMPCSEEDLKIFPILKRSSISSKITLTTLTPTKSMPKDFPKIRCFQHTLLFASMIRFLEYGKAEVD